MFHKATLVNQVLKLPHRDIVVVFSAHLAWAWIARGVRDGGCELAGVTGEEELVEGAFADAGGARDYDGSSVGEWG